MTASRAQIRALADAREAEGRAEAAEAEADTARAEAHEKDVDLRDLRATFREARSL